jgi:hypothetical protein
MGEKEKKLYELDAEALKRVAQAAQRIRTEISERTAAIERSAQLTEEDYSIRINARD